MPKKNNTSTRIARLFIAPAPPLACVGAGGVSGALTWITNVSFAVAPAASMADKVIVVDPTVDGVPEIIPVVSVS